jgi:hypothetical protein
VTAGERKLRCSNEQRHCNNTVANPAGNKQLTQAKNENAQIDRAIAINLSAARRGKLC